jgi:teichuronic acid biosynthesis glycosyltransferase TuaC
VGERLAVTWLTPWYPWDGDPMSGVFHRTQAQAVARHGVDVSVVAPRPAAPPPLPWLSERWAKYAAIPRAESDGPVQVARPPYLAVPGEPAWARPSWAVARAARGVISATAVPDLLHGHFVVPTGMATRRVAEDLHLPYVLTVHGYDATSWPAAHADHLDEYRATLRGAAAVISVSGAIGRRLHELSGVEAVTLPLGVDHVALRSLALPREEARAALGLPQDRFVVLFAARTTAHKGLAEFVEASLGLGDGYLAVVAGGGPMLNHRADEGRQGDRLRYVGPQDRAGVARHMCAADVLVLPSYQEGLPTVLVEAGSVGLPVIATAVDGTPELLADDAGLLIAPREPGAIVAAVRAAAADPAAASARAARLRARVEADYDVERNAGRLVDLYRDVIAASAGGPAR